LFGLSGTLPAVFGGGTSSFLELLAASYTHTGGRLGLVQRLLEVFLVLSHPATPARKKRSVW